MRRRKTRNHSRPYKISVDPGVTGTGYAIWESGISFRKLCPPISAGVINSRAGNWELRARNITRRLKQFLQDSDEVIIELGEFYDNPKGYAAAKRGDITKLIFIIGAISQAAWDSGVSKVTLFTPSVWKGQLSKTIVNRRVERILGKNVCRERMTYPNSHDWDAVALGLFAKGFF